MKKYKFSLALLLSFALIFSTMNSFALAESTDFNNVSENENNRELTVTEETKKETIDIIERASNFKQNNTDGEIRPQNVVSIIMYLARIAYGATKTYAKVTENHVEDAIKDYFDLSVLTTQYTNIKELWLIGSNKKVTIEFGTQSRGFEHIMSKHHPKYWTGLGYREYNSFFNDTTSMQEIVDIIAVVINYSDENKQKILNNYSNNVAVDGYYSGKLYRVVVDGNLKVVTAYPYGWNVAESR
ncbi:hypothetical protein MHI12_00960 [Paenibacillus sp. FSL H8-0280]|uniref:hypothetical protein n=1 Tax=Paenibacillus sp. FSL H8-0280 TaxID=2921382 RepID=UPI0032507C8C